MSKMRCARTKKRRRGKVGEGVEKEKQKKGLKRWRRRSRKVKEDYEVLGGNIIEKNKEVKIK